MLKALLRVRMTALGKWFTGATAKKGKQTKGSMIGFAFLMVYAFGAAGFGIWHVFDVLASPFHAIGLDWLVYAMAVMMDFGLMFIGSVFFAKSQLFEARDNELLLSLPVKPGDILISRLVMLLVINLVFSLPVVIPVIIVRCSLGTVGGYEVLAFALVFALLPFFALAVSALFGWLFSIITAHIGKGKGVIGMLLCVALILGYSWLMMKLNTGLLSDAQSQAQAIADSVGSSSPLYAVGAAIALGRGDLLAVVCAVFVAVGAAAYLLLERNFIRTATMKRGGVRNKYVEKREAAKTPDAALLGREFARFFSSSAYMVNAGLGAIMMIIAAVALVIKRADITALFSVPGISALLCPLLLAAICLLGSMNFVSAPSVNLEGRSLWIAQSLPVTVQQVLRAKLRLHLYICLIPALIASLAAVFVARPDAADAAALIIIPLLFGVFTGILGLVENLRHPSLDWSNEAQAVKTGVGLLFTMLISWAALIPPIVLYAVCDVDFNICAWGFAAAIAAADILLYRWLMSRGAEIYAAL